MFAVVDPDGGDAEARQIRAPPRGDQQLVADNHASACEVNCDPRSFTTHPFHFSLGGDLDALVPQYPRHQVACRWRFFGQ